MEAEELLPAVYDELRRLARANLSRERPGQTLEPTALVHEAYMRLTRNSDEKHWRGHSHFFAAAAKTMRLILVDRAREKVRQKRGGDRIRLELQDRDLAFDSPAEEIIAIDDALQRLSSEDELAAKVLDLRHFSGMSIEEAALALGISRASAYRHWTYARAWVRAELSDDESLSNTGRSEDS